MSPQDAADMWRILSDFASALTGLTANRLVRTNASKQLESNAALTNTRVLFADSNGWPTDSANLTWNGTTLAVTGTATLSTALVAASGGTGFSSYTAGDTIYASGTTTISKLAIGAANTVQTSSGSAPQWSSSLTLAGTLTVQSSTASTSTTTGALVVTGGVGIGGALNVGSGITASGQDYNLGAGGAGSANATLSFNGSSANDYGARIRLLRNSVYKGEYSTYGAIFGGSSDDITIRSASGVNIRLTNNSTDNILVGNGVNTLAVQTLCTHPTGGLGYGTGAGGTVTQATSRTTGVTINKVCGEITLVSAAGSASWQSFTVTNSAMAATDNVTVNQKSGTDLYMIHVTAKAAGSFRISFATTGGTTSEQPVFGFSIHKAVAA